MAFSVATRLVVSDEPVFCNAKLTVTVSAGSIPPLVQLSLTNAVALMTNWLGTTATTVVEALSVRFGSATLLHTEAELV